MQQLLRGARVVDGTGAPARSADVVIDAGRIVAVDEPGRATGAEIVELDGLALAPGFVDPHTHYDAQVLWDPDLTPSSWHGVTTVVMGNCGFGIAPTRPEHREAIARTLENVEGMSVEALTAGIPWTFETFPEYLDAVEAGGLRLNVAAMIGHTPLRRYVVGDEAVERAATDDEIRTMRRLVGEALDAGAFGFATSKSPMHKGDAGRPVPSRLATLDEITEIGGELGRHRQGVIAATYGPGLFIDELAALSAATGRPVTWTALMGGMSGMDPMAVLEQARHLGGEVWPQIACRPVVMQVVLTEPMPFAVARAFKEVLATPPEGRRALYADPDWRERARRDVAASVWGSRWDQISVQETTRHPELRDGPSLAVLAAQRQADPLDVMVDLALEEDLATRFRVVLGNEDEAQVAALLQQPDTLLGLSDAGAHASQLCDACYSTHLLGYWVREQQCLSLQAAVWRLTGQPADVFRIRGRGRIAPGYAADLVAFDPDTVGVEPLERVWDLPAGADRLIARSRGVESMWVNGERTRAGGVELDGVRPGRLLRATHDE